MWTGSSGLHARTNSQGVPGIELTWIYSPRPGFARIFRNQLIGGLLLLIVIWMVILYRMLFSAA